MPNAPKVVTACVVVIGNEVLSGRTQDTNVQFLATALGEIGIRLAEVRIIPDVEETIISTVGACAKAHDYVFTTGGIGPTHDDITTRCIAKLFDRPVELNPQAEKLLRHHYGDDNVTEARMKMAHVPVGATLVANPISKAPGFRLENVFVLAGVPIIAKCMFDSLKSELIGGDRVHSLTISAELPEGRLASGMEEIENRYAHLEIGSYPYYRNGRFGVSIVLRGTNTDTLSSAGDELRELMQSMGGTPIEGEVE